MHASGESGHVLDVFEGSFPPPYEEGGIPYVAPVVPERTCVRQMCVE
jgi:hypothetical protein